MTTNQVIAMLFPVGTTVAVALTAWGIVRWVEKQRAADRVREAGTISDTD